MMFIIFAFLNVSFHPSENFLNWSPTMVNYKCLQLEFSSNFCHYSYQTNFKHCHFSDNVKMHVHPTFFIVLTLNDHLSIISWSIHIIHNSIFDLDFFSGVVSGYNFVSFFYHSHSFSLKRGCNKPQPNIRGHNMNYE